MSRERFDERKLEGKEVQCSFCDGKFHLKYEDTVSGYQVITIKCPFCEEIFTIDIDEQLTSNGRQLTDDREPLSIDKMKEESTQFMVVGLLMDLSGVGLILLPAIVLDPLYYLMVIGPISIMSSIIMLIGGLFWLYGFVRWVSIKTILEMRNLE